MRELKITQTYTNRSESLDLYLKSIAKEKLISPDEEVALAVRIHNGDERALDQMVRANLRFVVSIAKQYVGYGLDIMDLIDEGNMGLIEAAHRFDETRGFKFISFAVWWIRQHILLALTEHSNTVRTPLNHVHNITKINKEISKFEQEHERVPSTYELAEILEISEDKVVTAMNLSARSSSLDAPIVSGEDGTYLDIMSDSGSPATDRSMIDESLTQDVDAFLEQLSPREKNVICLFYGLGGHREHTLDEIGYMLNLSRERVRQIKERSIRMLRVSPEARYLRTYLS